MKNIIVTLILIAVIANLFIEVKFDHQQISKDHEILVEASSTLGWVVPNVLSIDCLIQPQNPVCPQQPASNVLK